jgi:hypothetical protein
MLNTRKIKIKEKVVEMFFNVNAPPGARWKFLNENFLAVLIRPTGGTGSRPGALRDRLSPLASCLRHDAHGRGHARYGEKSMI